MFASDHARLANLSSYWNYLQAANCFANQQRLISLNIPTPPIFGLRSTVRVDDLVRVPVCLLPTIDNSSASSTDLNQAPDVDVDQIHAKTGSSPSKMSDDTSLQVSTDIRNMLTDTIGMFSHSSSCILCHT